MISCLPGSRNCHGPRIAAPPSHARLDCDTGPKILLDCDTGPGCPDMRAVLINSLANGGINLYLDQLGQFQSLN